MFKKRTLWLLVLVSLLSAVATPQLLAHITMTGSNPKDGQALSGDVKEIRLFFSGAPLLRGASVRIVTASRSLVRSSPPAADPKDRKQLFVQIPQGLAPGSYVIQWRCIASDGHVMRGDFRFRVEA